MSNEPETHPFLRPLFRKAALERRGQAEDLDGLLRVTAPHEWIVLMLMALMLALVVLWASFGRVEQSVTAQCVLVEPGEMHSVIASADGTIAELLSDVGDEVRLDEPIARLRLPELERQITALETQIAILETDPQPSQSAISLSRAELAGLNAALQASRYISSPSAGTLAWLELSVGQPIATGDEVARVRNSTGELQALSFVEASTAARLSAGLNAQIALLSGADPTTKRAVVSQVSSTPVPPDRQAQFTMLSAPEHGVALVADLTDPATPDAAEGDLCQLRVTVSRQRPISFIAHPTDTAAPNL